MRHEMIQSWIVDNQPVFHEWEGITAPCHDIIWNAFDLVNAMLKHFLSKTHVQHVLFTKIIQIDFFSAEIYSAMSWNRYQQNFVSFR